MIHKFYKFTFKYQKIKCANKYLKYYPVSVCKKKVKMFNLLKEKMISKFEFYHNLENVDLSHNISLH